MSQHAYVASKGACQGTGDLSPVFTFFFIFSMRAHSKIDAKLFYVTRGMLWRMMIVKIPDSMEVGCVLLTKAMKTADWYKC